jgi:aspartate/methionine/tyrosine aminotransferase
MLLHAQPAAQRATAGEKPQLSRRGAALAAIRRASPVTPSRAFQVGLPAVDHFPIDLWARLLARRVRTPTRSSLGYDYAAGYPPLCEAVAQYLGAARGVVCRPEQVIVVAGAQAGLDLACRLLLDPGDPAWIEEPGYVGARGALLGASATLVPVPVDDEGLDVAAGARRAPRARLAYTSPSHQLPLGVTTSLARRLQLLDWATRAGAWILEDDYDSEYRYGGRPLAAMQGIDATGRVIYVGTFSKTLFPALRVGYLVVPPSLVEPFSVAMRTPGTAPVAVQAASPTSSPTATRGARPSHARPLCDSPGAFLRCEEHLAGVVDMRPKPACTWSRSAGRRDDVAITARSTARRCGLCPRTISSAYARAAPRLCLVAEGEIDRGVEQLASVLHMHGRQRAQAGVRSKA